MNLLKNFCCPPRTTINWEISPLHDTFLRINLNYEVSSRLSMMMGIPEISIKQIEDMADDLIPLLDRAWLEYGLKGSILLSPWHEDISSKIDPQSRDLNLLCLVHSRDPMLVLNILSRSRSGILLPQFPPLLELPFLKRDLATGDRRLVSLAKKEKANGRE